MQKIKSDSLLVGTELMGTKIEQDLPCAIATFDPLHMISFVLWYIAKCISYALVLYNETLGQ